MTTDSGSDTDISVSADAVNACSPMLITVSEPQTSGSAGDGSLPLYPVISA